MSKRILILGAGMMQGVAISRAKERGWTTVVIDANPEAPCRSLADRFEPIDLKDVSAIVDFAKELQNNGGLDGVFTAATDFSVSVAAAAAACGLPGHSVQAAHNASDKLRMRDCFNAAGIPSPCCLGVDTDTLSSIYDELAASGISFPVVVKPVDNMGARGCVRVNAHAELLDACIQAIRYSRTGKAIIEAYMDGPEFSVEALVYDGEFHVTGFADRHIAFPPYFVEMGHTIPADIPDAERERIVAVFRSGAAALGLSHGAAKGDIKLTQQGPMVGEIAARLSGGYMSGWTFPYSSGIDLTGAALSLAVGERPGQLDQKQDLVCAERAWISIPGTIASVTGLDEAASLPGVKNVFPRVQEGDTVSFPRNNVEKCGNCLALHENRDEACRMAQDACSAVFLRLTAHDPVTTAYMEGVDQPFPPSAFQVPPVAGETFFTDMVFDTCGTLPVPASLENILDREKDWQQRTLRQAIEQALRLEPGLKEKLIHQDKNIRIRYWNALLRGGIQGIVYAYDCKKR